MNNDKEQTIKLDVYADIACPWCYIGVKRLNAALEQRPGVTVERSWKAFQLRPEMPREGIEWGEFMETKFGGRERAQGAFERVAEAGAPDGINFRFDLVKHAPNTQNAHRLVMLAEAEGREWEMAQGLFAAYFEQGRDVGDTNTLVEIAGEIGLDRDVVRAYLSSDDNRTLVESSQETAQQLGVDGVPFYVLNDRFGISGAQPVEHFVAALDRVGELEEAA